MPFMYCDPPSAVVRIVPPTGPSHAGVGRATLASGATFEIWMAQGNSPSDGFVVKLRKTDHIEMCYAPPQTWADEGPGARMAIIGDVEDGEYMYGVAYPAKAH